jgi:hypothetical protein
MAKTTSFLAINKDYICMQMFAVSLYLFRLARINKQAIIRLYLSLLLSKKLQLSHTYYAGAKGEIIYSSYSFLASALVAVRGQHHAQAAL